jgi:hypothetical protein
MQLLRAGEKPPVGVVFDTGLTRIDEALALALLFGLDGKREARVVSISIGRPSLKAAAFCDVLQRVYSGGPSPFARTLSIGMDSHGKMADGEPMLDTALARPEAKTDIVKVNDTADPAALIRNAFTAHHDGNCIAILAGPAINYLNALSLRDARQLAAAKVRLLTVLPDASDLENTNKLLAEWPGPVVVVPQEIGDSAPFPAANIVTGFSWSAAPHPLVDAYKAYKPMPYDAPTPALAAVMHSVRAKENYFKLSDPGTITVQEGGKLKLVPGAQGKHRHLIADPAQKERLLAAYIELVTAKPVPRAPRFRPMPQEQKPPADAPKPSEGKPAAPSPINPSPSTK